MIYTAQIVVQGAQDECSKLINAIKLELGDFGRSTVSVEPCETGAIFKINSQDATSLRATLNSVSQSLSIFEKMEITK